MPDTPATPPKPRAKPAAQPKVAATSKAVAKPKVAVAAPPNSSGLPGDPPQSSWVKVGVGVGSAALVAALLYATRSKRNDWTK
jgi:hypothetical protein